MAAGVQQIYMHTKKKRELIVAIAISFIKVCLQQTIYRTNYLRHILFTGSIIFSIKWLHQKYSHIQYVEYTY